MTNPNTASPVTRSIEITDKIANALNKLRSFSDQHADDLVLGDAKALLSYITQLEASQPKPQSDEGLRETLVSIVERCQFSKQHGDDIGRQNTISFILRDAQAALSRQAPVPTQSDGDLAVRIAELARNMRDKPYEDLAAAIEPMVNMATQEAHAAGTQHGLDIAAERARAAPVPTSGAVEVAAQVLTVLGLNDVYDSKQKAAAIIQKAISEARFQGHEDYRIAWATQPQAADGKLEPLPVPPISGAQKSAIDEQLDRLQKNGGQTFMLTPRLGVFGLPFEWVLFWLDDTGQRNLIPITNQGICWNEYGITNLCAALAQPASGGGA